MARKHGNAGLQTGSAPRSGAKPHIATGEEARGRLGTPTSGRHSLPEAGGVAYRHTPGWFPSRRCPHPRRWRSRARPRFRSVSIAPLAPLCGAVPGPTGRTAQRSAQFSRWGLPCLRVAPPGGMGAMRHVQRPRGAFCDSASAPEVEKCGLADPHEGLASEGTPTFGRHPGDDEPGGFAVVWFPPSSVAGPKQKLRAGPIRPNGPPSS